jgi:hypothetical protein
MFLGLNGVFLSWPVSDFLSFAVTILFVLMEIRIINRAAAEQALSN